MQRPSAANIHLPYSKWSQHCADNGLIYLSHPVTGEVKWLWSRHNDPKTSNDYLVNTVTGERQWVTKENEHLCPLPLDKSSNQQKANHSETNPNASSNPFTEKRSQRKKPASAVKRQPTAENAEKYREIAAPKSLGLTADEVLMLVPETGRRYIFNKKTNSSRWLPDRPPDTIPATTPTQRTFLGRTKTKAADRADDDIHPELRERTKTPFFDPNDPPKTDHDPHTNVSSETPFAAHKLSNSHTAANNTTNNTSSRPPTNGAHPSQHSRTNQSRVPAASPDDANSPRRAKPQAPPNADAPKRTASSQPRNDVNPVTEKLDALGSILGDVKKITASGKYSMDQFRRLPMMRGKEEQHQEGSQRLLELEEYLTQQMLRVDAVESEGNQLVRAKRKETVNTILGLTDEIEQLRTKLKKL